MCASTELEHLTDHPISSLKRLAIKLVSDDLRKAGLPED
jgi:hypothetical protein